MKEKRIYTIGHSTHPIETFIEMLGSFGIEVLADIRNFPGSRRYPQFNSEALSEVLTKNGLTYLHLRDLGGRRTPLPDSKNDGWRVAAFKGYADYMETPAFQSAFAQLEQIASQKMTAYMCSEAVWWSCHRSLVSDLFKHKGWTVLHIMKAHKSEEHPYTKPARIVNGKLVYSKPGLFDGT